jgi:hypothetical protein
MYLSWEVTGNLRKLQNEEPHGLYYSPKNIKDDQIQLYKYVTLNTDFFKQL